MPYSNSSVNFIPSQTQTEHRTPSNKKPQLVVFRFSFKIKIFLPPAYCYPSISENIFDFGFSLFVEFLSKMSRAGAPFVTTYPKVATSTFALPKTPENGPKLFFFSFHGKEEYPGYLPAIMKFSYCNHAFGESGTDGVTKFWGPTRSQHAAVRRIFNFQSRGFFRGELSSQTLCNVCEQLCTYHYFSLNHELDIFFSSVEQLDLNFVAANNWTNQGRY